MGNPGAFKAFCEGHHLPYPPLLASPTLQTVAFIVAILLLSHVLPIVRKRLSSRTTAMWQVGGNIAGALFIVAGYPTHRTGYEDCLFSYYDPVSFLDIAAVVVIISSWSVFIYLLGRADQSRMQLLRNIISYLIILALIILYGLTPARIDIFEMLSDFSDFLFESIRYEIDLWF